MSLFDMPRPFLNPAIWTKDEQIQPKVREYIMDLLEKIFPIGRCYRMILLGSNITYQYSDSSDIDVQVMAVPGEDYDYWHKVFKTYNDQNHLLPGTEYPINFFFVEYFDASSEGGWDNSQGAYDILREQWIKRPKTFESIGDPQKHYANEIQYVNLMVDMIESELLAVKEAVALGDREKAFHSIKSLQQFFKHIDENRRLSYQYMDSPYSQENNLVFKLIEHGPYGKLFKDLLG